MKRILCLIDSLGAGGAQRQMVGLSTLLQQKGYSIKIITYYDIPFYEAVLKENNIEYQCVAGRNTLWHRLSGIRKAIRDYRPDLVLSYLDTPNILACILKAFSGKWKLIVSERNTTQRLSMRERIKYLLFRYADLIVPNSYSQSQFLESHYPSLFNKCHVITNFVDTDLFTTAEPSRDEGALRLIGVGRIESQKNIPRLIQAVRNVREKGLQVSVDWYGKGYDTYDDCVRLIQEYGLNDCFRFLPPYHPIVEKYHSADIFVLPSLYEGFPNVLCEAMSCGLPVLCSNVCDNPTIMQDGNNGFLFNPSDVDDITEKMLRIIQLPFETRMEMGKVSRELALQKFSSESFVNKYIQVFNSIA